MPEIPTIADIDIYKRCIRKVLYTLWQQANGTVIVVGSTTWRNLQQVCRCAYGEISIRCLIKAIKAVRRLYSPAHRSTSVVALSVGQAQSVVLE